MAGITSEYQSFAARKWMERHRLMQSCMTQSLRCIRSSKERVFSSPAGRSSRPKLWPLTTPVCASNLAQALKGAYARGNPATCGSRGHCGNSAPHSAWVCRDYYQAHCLHTDTNRPSKAARTTRSTALRGAANPVATKPNHAIQLTAGRSGTSLKVTSTLPLQTKLALASGS